MDMLERARELRWYHTMELGPGEVTEGVFDLRRYVPNYGLPERMDGMRALDVGTFDGFWAFEMERRGAEVVAIDVDLDSQLDWPAVTRPTEFPDPPRGMTFELAKETYGSSVQRHNLSVYDATPEELGTFDLVFSGSVITHLRDPVLALERIAALCRDLCVLAEAYHRWLRLIPFAVAHFRGLRPGAAVFWEPNVRAWRRMLEASGFRSVQTRARFTLRSRAGWKIPHVILHARK